MLDRLQDCHSYFNNLKEFSVAFNNVTVREKQFPLAFGIPVYHDIGILEAMLMLMFRPMDSYCIHIDLKAPGN